MIKRPLKNVVLLKGMDHGQGKSCETLASVTLPPLPKPSGHSASAQSRISTGAVAAHPRLPGGAIRLPPPTPPPRPSNTLYPSVPRSSNTTTRLSSQSQNVSSPPSTNTSLSSQASRTEGGQQQNNLFSSLVSTIQQPLPLSLSRNSGGSGGLLAETAGVTESTQNITLFTPRTHRQQNVYVDTPIKKSDPLPPLSSNNATPLNSIKRLGGGLHRTHPHTPHMPVSVPSSNHNKSLPTVITQPLAASGGGSIHGGICKPPTAISSNLSSPTPSSDSIICGECGKCRCASCRSARPLPKAWICDNKCLCSVESCVDTLSCMCCVKAGLYHCGEFVARGDQAADTHEQEWVDNPCSCSSNNW